MSVQYRDLFDAVDFTGCEVLNQKSGQTIKSLIKNRDDDLALVSDSDEQLLISIPFQEKVKIHSLSVRAPADDSAPRTIKLFANKNSLGFDDVSDLEPVQTIVIEKDDLAAKDDNTLIIPLKFVKFQNVTILTIFVEDNHGEEYTTLSRVTLIGSKLAGTNVNDIKKQEEGM
eukprot:GFYU01003127.1.p2 GENE.GFYU01003127.1~~GFYU01003127.1.p2  ORF type:complete len:180 (+),score=60.93 GFYU01003127.1:27-542(+)